MRKLSVVSALAMLLGLASAACAGAPADSAIDFIHMSDTHVIRTQGIAQAALPKDIAQKQDSGARLRRFLAEAPARYHVQFFVHSGDATDGFAYQGTGTDMVEGQIQHLRTILSQSPVPIYIALGNHDVTQYLVLGGQAYNDQSIAGEARAAWTRTMPEFGKGTYYSFEKAAGGRRYLFLMLDDGYYGGPLDTRTLIDRPARVQHFDYAQLYWMLAQLRAHPTDVPVLVMHVPLTDDEMSRQIEAVVRLGTDAPVVLALVGHLHVSSAIDDIPLRAGQTLVQVHTTAFFLGSDQWRRIRMTGDCVWISRTDDHATAQRVLAVGTDPAACPAGMTLR